MMLDESGAAFKTFPVIHVLLALHDLDRQKFFLGDEKYVN